MQRAEHPSAAKQSVFIGISPSLSCAERTDGHLRHQLLAFHSASPKGPNSKVLPVGGMKNNSKAFRFTEVKLTVRAYIKFI